MRILFIPLDDRPPCWQFPEKIAEIGQIEMVSPPKEMLGNFTDYGHCDALATWIKSQNLANFDAAILSVDMLVYGGLVASRVGATPLEAAQGRLHIIEYLRKTAPKLKIYANGVMMRLAPTADGKNEAYRESLARWAEYSAVPEQAAKTRELEASIPNEVLQSYRATRQRNLQINKQLVDLVQQQQIDYLILSQDDAKLQGVHLAERQQLIEQITALRLADKIAIQPGTDEVSMLLLARTVSDATNFRPKIHVIYASDAEANKAMPYEDRPLRQTVSYHIIATGVREASNAAQADIIFFVYNTRFENGGAAKFVQQIEHVRKKWPKKGNIVADIDTKGAIQGSDKLFTDLLLQRKIVYNLSGYASWNTAGNTIGTALPHGFIYEFAKTRLPKTKSNWAKLAATQTWFTTNRLLDDYYYHAVVRPQALNYIRQQKWNAFRLTPEQTVVVEQFCQEALQPYATSLSKYIQGFQLKQVTCHLPWNRTFEADINFQLIPTKK